jgi:hypothetical protein
MSLAIVMQQANKQMAVSDESALLEAVARERLVKT